MDGRPADQDAGALAVRVGELGELLDAIADDEVRETAHAFAQGIADMHGEGLARIFASLSREDGERLAQDGVVASLMLLHGLYPVDLETRVREALDEVSALPRVPRRRRRARRADGRGRPAAAPDRQLRRLRRVGRHARAGDRGGTGGGGARPARARGRRRRRAPARRRRPPARRHRLGRGTGRPPSIGRGELTVIGRDLLIANVAGTLLAYRDTCAGCGGPLRDGLLIGGTLTCAACERSFDLPRAGRERDGGDLQLAPVPLLRGGGEVKVALPRSRQQAEVCDLCGIGIARGPPPPARADRAAHGLRLRDVLVAALRRPRVPAHGRPRRVARGLRPPRRRLGRVRDPRRARVPPAVGRHGRDGGALPEPRRRHGVRRSIPARGRASSPPTRSCGRWRPTPRRSSSTAPATRRAA